MNLRRRDVIAAMLTAPLARAAEARYQATWESLDTRPSPQWYTDAKFGIFIHWGVYSVPAFAPVSIKGQTPYAEWYWNSLQSGKSKTVEFHNRVYGNGFPYESFAPLFKAELYNPDRWADTFVKSGARYVALTSKHHEGYTLWKSAEANRSWGRPWNSVDVGARRDLLIDLMEAGRAKGLHMGIYYSLYEWFNPLWLRNKLRYVADHMTPQFKDVVTHAKPSIIFSDGEWDLDSPEWKSPELLQWLFNESPVADEVVINDRWGKDCRHVHGGYYTTEYTSGMQKATHPWEESRGMGFSYGFNRAERLQDYHTARELTMMLIDIVSRGGNLLLDIGPAADGTIPVLMEERLEQIGKWLIPNGEAIYGTTAWAAARQWSEGTVPVMEDKQFMSAYDIKQMTDTPPSGYARVDAFFTAKGNTIYAILPRWPGATASLKDIPARAGAKITLLETGDALAWKQNGQRLEVTMPARGADKEAYVLKIEPS